MKSSRLIPWLALGLLEAGFLVYVWQSADHLPARVASHFTAAGTANGWMPQEQYVRFITGFGVLFPLLWAVGLPGLLRVSPPEWWNLPHREHWLSPERRPETQAFLAGHLRWFACLAVLFAAGVHASVTAANTFTPPHLSGPSIRGVAGAFLVAGLGWTFVLWRRFARVPGS